MMIYSIENVSRNTITFYSNVIDWKEIGPHIEWMENFLGWVSNCDAPEDYKECIGEIEWDYTCEDIESVEVNIYEGKATINFKRPFIMNEEEIEKLVVDVMDLMWEALDSFLTN